MAEKKATNTQSRGACAFCNHIATKAGMTKHLPLCPQRQAASAAATLPAETLLHLRVQDAYCKDFWLDLEMSEAATLKELDTYLRAIWLECCGHMSKFTGDGWGSATYGMSRKAGDVFEETASFLHIYDFGTSSETRIALVGTREGAPLSKHPITLLSRNLIPQEPCFRCSEPAAFMCIGCQGEHDTSGLLCVSHARNHDHEEFGEPLPLVNSPRLGMCGYDGPAEPPY